MPLVYLNIDTEFVNIHLAAEYWKMEFLCSYFDYQIRNGSRVIAFFAVYR